MTAAFNASQEMPFRPGEVLDGKFRVERVLGVGSMGLVVEATHLSLDERVALKFLRPEALARPEIVSRFAREARAAVRIKSDHVARVFDVGTHEGAPFIVMEFLEGSDLGIILENRRKLDISEAVDYVLQACEGLAEAHARGIVHRDIKPENLFLSGGLGSLRRVKILDFGISKAGIVSGETDLQSGDTTQIMGSPQYMSPEQIRSTRDVDARADLWSLGIVLYELITGTVPWSATEVSAIISQILYEEPRKLRALSPDAPAELEAILDRCLTKDPQQRIASAADLAVALLPFAPKHARSIVEKVGEIARSSGGIAIRRDDSLPPPPPLAGASTSTTFAAAETSPSVPAPRRRSALPLVAGAVAVFLVLGASAAFLFFRGAPTGAPPEPATAATGEPATTAAAPPIETSLSPASAAAPAAEPVASAGTIAPSSTAKAPPKPVAHAPAALPATAAAAPAAVPAKPSATAKPAKPAGAAPADSDIVRAR